MIEPSFYNLKNQGKNKEKTRNFVLKTRVFGKRTEFLKARSLKTPSFGKKDGVFERTEF